MKLLREKVLEAENLQMREALGTLSKGNRYPSTLKLCQDALKLPHTSRLAKRMELLERVVEELREHINGVWTQGPVRDALKQLDALDQEGW